MDTRRRDGEEIDMRSRARARRRQGNPLRRRSDIVEAWTALAVTVLLVLGSPLAGVVTGWWAYDDARAMAAQQRADRHRVSAEVVGTTPDRPPAMQGAAPRTFSVEVRWTEAGGRARTAEVRVPAGTRSGDTVDVWFDSAGRNVPAPPGETAAWQHAFTLGICSAGATAATVLLAQSAVRRGAMRRRMAEWDRDWALTEPQWTRRSRGEI
ncbi:DUF3592 domain-containing protein [Streptomyces sp. MUM 2J]|uniref:Rv1733c family protein n=1 Tax=Streptomyces sp. MUM 2J TaxID=2791987 RepID=UPI0027E5259E|nr:DUF3592 domain-containing protein [Streptomyces sp. MUM 2J]